MMTMMMMMAVTYLTDIQSRSFQTLQYLYTEMYNHKWLENAVCRFCSVADEDCEHGLNILCLRFSTLFLILGFTEAFVAGWRKASS